MYMCTPYIRMSASIMPSACSFDRLSLLPYTICPKKLFLSFFLFAPVSLSVYLFFFFHRLRVSLHTYLNLHSLPLFLVTALPLNPISLPSSFHSVYYSSYLSISEFLQSLRVSLSLIFSLYIWRSPVFIIFPIFHVSFDF